MATEVERKFLVTGTQWRDQVSRSASIRQAYLSYTPAMSVRVRIIDDRAAFLTVKSAALEIARAEFEYAIPVEDARGLFALRTGNVVEKRRHIVEIGQFKWEVDVFEGAHAGLVIAEIELPHADAPFERPAWLGAEVTGDRRYYNVSLAGAERIGNPGS